VGKSDKKDPIRKLLAGCTPSLFLGNPPGTVAIMQSKVVDAGGDPDAVLAWVKEHGGQRDSMLSTSAQCRRGFGPRPRHMTKPFYVIPEDALK